jgi:FMN phosphatase YigB (HAD superfamily)
MPFRDDDDLNRFFYETLKPCLEKNNYICERADISEGQNLDRRIIDGIYNADIIIADLTGQNCNVLYELGISHTIPKKTLMISQSLDSIPFDVNTYDVIEYNPNNFNKKQFMEKFKKMLANTSQRNLVTDHRPDIKKDILHDLNIKRLQSIFENIPKIIFIDLDGTLFDSHEQRTRASKKAFGKIFGNKTEEELNGIYESIYSDHNDYEKITGKNFRYDWLTKDIYRIAYLKENGIDPKSKQKYLQYCLDRIDSKTLGAIEDAYEVFMNEPFEPHPYAEQFLEVLKTLKFKLILVTEGNEKVQEWKLKQLNFDTFFSDSHIGMARENLQKLEEYLDTNEISKEVEREYTLIYKEYKQMHDERKNNFHANTLRKVIENPDFEGSFHLAVIGDRYDADLKPYEAIDKTNILRIAVTKVKGKYEQPTLDEIDKLEDASRKTLHSITELSEALELLIEPDTWKDLKPITSIPKNQTYPEDPKKIGEITNAIGKISAKDETPFARYGREIISYLKERNKDGQPMDKNKI